MSGRFAIVEGLDFSGKSTLAALIVEELAARGRPAVRNTAKDRRLRAWSRRLAQQPRVPALAADVLFLLAVLHDTARIRRRLRRGVTVVQDRYYPSYVWNQLAIPGANGRPRRKLLWLYRSLRPLFLEPDVTVYCHCSPRTLRARYAAENPGALSPNDRSVFAIASLERHAAAFEQALAGQPRLVRCRNEGTIDDLRATAAMVVDRLTAQETVNGLA